MAVVWETEFTRRFGLRVPLVQAPMGGVAGPKLVAAVAQAGALGMLPVWFLPPDAAAGLIARTRAATERPFAVNLRADLEQHDLIAASIDAGAVLIHLFWGDPTASARVAHTRGARTIATVWDTDSARRALDAGAAALLAQGMEAGGHVKGTIPLAELVPLVLAEARDVPVAAAGGLADAADVARVLRLGAGAAALGTRFAATVESAAHDDYKRALVAAGAGSTVLSTCFDGLWPDAPHRTLRNSTYTRWEAAGRPEPGARPGEGDIVLREPDGTEVPRYSMVLPMQGTDGDTEAAALYAGTGVDRITDLPSAAEVVERLVSGLDTV